MGTILSGLQVAFIDLLCTTAATLPFHQLPLTLDYGKNTAKKQAIIGDFDVVLSEKKKRGE